MLTEIKDIQTGSIPQHQIITGGPGSGKTTIIDILEILGYNIVPEAATQIIEENKKNEGKKAIETRDDEMGDFQSKVVNRKLELDKKISPTSVTFADRGIEDTFVYRLAYSEDVDKIISKYSKQKKIPYKTFLKYIEENEKTIAKKCLDKKYNAVFLLEQGNNYEKGDNRKEDANFAKKLEILTGITYKALNHEIIKVPIFSNNITESLQKRISLILKESNLKTKPTDEIKKAIAIVLENKKPQ